MNNIDILERVCECRRFSGVFTDVECIFKAIENIISENKELKEKNKELEEEDVKIRAKFILQLDNYIPKSKVEEEIKELHERIKANVTEDEYNFYRIYTSKDFDLYVKSVLQSLLGKE